MSFYLTQARRRSVSDLWRELGTDELWNVFETALGSRLPAESALGGTGLLARGDPDDAKLLAQAADRLAPHLPLTEKGRDAVSTLAGASFSPRFADFSLFAGYPSLRLV